MDIIIRNEIKDDYRQVEELTRNAFWNLYGPGCSEHYLAHKMRTHKDFIPQLDFIALYDGKIVGNIMYAKSYLLDDSGNKMETITFGPLSVLPEYQRQGIGSALFQHSKNIALENNYKAILIYGAPYNYCKHGFKSCKDYNVANPERRFPYALLALELEKEILKGRNWKFYTSDIYNLDEDALEEYDKTFNHMEKGYKYTQEIFSIECRSYIDQLFRLDFVNFLQLLKKDII